MATETSEGFGLATTLFEFFTDIEMLCFKLRASTAPPRRAGWRGIGPAKPTAVRAATAVAPVTPSPPLTDTPSWDDLRARLAPDSAGATYAIQPATLNAPGSAPVPTVRAIDDDGETPPRTEKALLLIKDTNNWCPFAARCFLYLHSRFGVDGAAAVYDTAFVNLRQKPKWHLKAAAANGAKVPAVFMKRGGEDVCLVESLDIIKALEADPGLAQVAPPFDATADATTVAAGLALADALSLAGYGLARAVAPPPAPGSPYAALPPPPPVAEARATFESALAEFTQLLQSTPGPFVGGGSRPSTADVALAPHFERLAANLPFTVGVDIDPRNASPAISSWMDALESDPAYLATRGDAGTHRIVSKRLFGGALAEAPYVPADAGAAAEAAAKLVANRAAIVADAAKNSGITDESKIDAGVRRVAATLVTGRPGPASSDDPAANAAAAAVAAFLASRVSAPRDMSGSAAAELRAACVRTGAAAFTGL